MRTKHPRALFPEYLDRKLSSSDHLEVQRHVEQCKSCRDELSQLRQTMDLLNQHRAPAPPEGYFATVLPRIRERLAQDERKNLLRFPVVKRLVVPLAAVAVAIFLLLAIPFEANDSGDETNPLHSVLGGADAQELYEVVIDVLPLQPFAGPLAEGEVSSLFAASVLRNEDLLADADEGALSGEITFDDPSSAELEQLTEEDLELLLQRLGERTFL